MQLNDTAIVLNTRKYNDSSIIMKVITENNGIYSGLVRIKKNQGGFGVNITGNKLNLMWRARLSEHLGFFTTELNKSRAHEIMKDQIFLSGINLICSHLDLYPEREPCQNIYIEFDNLIDNLPSNCCVEVPVIINSKGYKPQKFGKLPEQLAALMRTNINVQILTAEAALTKKREHIYHAAMLDPLTGANLTIDEIYSMTDKMIEAHGNYLPQYN